MFIVVTSALLVVAAMKQFGIDLQAMWSRGGVRGLISVSGLVYTLAMAKVMLTGLATAISTLQELGHVIQTVIRQGTGSRHRYSSTGS